MSLPADYTIVETTTQKLTGYTWETEILVNYEPATVSDLDQKQRWFLAVGDQVTAVRRVKVTCRPKDRPTSGWSEQGYEIDFACGAKGYVTEYADHRAELNALTVGTKGYLHGLAVFRKHRHIVGSPTPWFRAQPSKRKRMNPNTAPRCCALELYTRAQGKPWGT